MASKQFLVPGNHATVRGIVAPGATASLYTTGTTTPQAFYSDDTRLVSLGTTITADAIGNFPIAYQDETVPFRLILKDRLGATLDGGDIDPFYFGVTTLSLPAAASSYATRTDMAAVSATTGSMAYLREAGREGTFVWSTANNAANVTADTKQGIYVPPASDTTGASGAWVRKYSGAANALWFGFVADMTANGVGTNNTPMFDAARTALIAAGRNWLHIPQQSAAYRFSTAPAAIHDGILVTGEGWYQNPGQVGATTYVGIQKYPGTVLGFAADVPAFKLVAYTDNASNALAYEYQGAIGSTFRDLMLYSEGGTGTTSHGFESFVKFNLQNVRIEGFAGCGVKIEGDESGTVNQYGNPILSNLTNVYCVSNKLHGYHISGSNGSVINLTNCHAQLNGGVAFLDNGPFGNTYTNCLAATNNASFGTPAGYSAAQRTKVTTDYAGLATQANGSFVCTGASAISVYTGCYPETGNGYNPDLSSACVVSGGALSAVARQSNVGTNGNPHVVSNDGLTTFKVTYDRAQANLGAITAKAATYRHADQGLVLQGSPDGGGATDVTVRNKSDTAVIQIPTGTTTTKHFGTVWADFSPFFVNGSSAFPGLIATQAAMFTTATNGLMLAGFGSTYDTALANKTGGVALGVLTGTVNLAAAGSFAATGAVTGSNLSGTNTGDQTITLTGNVTGTGTGSFAATIANDAVTYAKMQNVSATNRFLGRITAGAGDPEELTGTQASTLLDAATTSLQGVMSAQDKTRMDAAFTVYRSLLDCSGSITAAQAAATYGMGQGDPLAVSGTGTLYPLNSIHIASADYPALGTLNPKLRIRVNIECNDVAPGVTFTVGLHPITRPATSGGAGVCIYTIGSAVASSTIAVATPAADSSTAAVTAADFSLPADGRYVIGVVTSGGALAASSHCHLSAVLQMRYA